MSEEIYHAFLYDPFKDDVISPRVDLGTLPGQFSSEASAINASGQVVGRSGSAAFLYNGHTMLDLNGLVPTRPAGMVIVDAVALSDNGSIVAYTTQGLVLLSPELTDIVAPTVTITAPDHNATVSGTILVSADATDDVGVAGVQFKLNGVNLGSEDTTAPYDIAWDTTTVPGGTDYSVTAVARDAAGNYSTRTIFPYVSNPSLIHYWKFDETSGTTAADQEGGSAQLTNVSWVAGQTGNAVYLNGSNAYGTAGTIDFGTGNFTVAHWVKVTAFKSYAGIFNNRSSSSGNPGFQTRTDSSNSITALIDFGATSKSLALTNAVSGIWNHVAVSVDRAGLMKLYVNGGLLKQVDISAFSSASITNSSGVRIGRDYGSNYYSGAIDDLRLYDSALSDVDILTLNNE